MKILALLFYLTGWAPESHFVQEATVAESLEAYRVNALGPMILFQRFSSLLRVKPGGKFVISSGAGSIQDGRIALFPIVEYAMSKTAVNFLTWKIHAENPDLIVFPLKWAVTVKPINL